MTRARISTIVLFAALAATMACSSIEKDEPLDGCRWMLGDWREENGDDLVIESWREISGKTFEGKGSTLDRNVKKVTSEESLRLVSMSGEIFYFAKVSQNNMPTPFKLVTQDKDTLVFENLKHDFPQRLTYRRVDDNHLHVDVQDTQGKGFVLKFTRNILNPMPAF